MADRLVVSQEGPVRILRIQRPEVRNAIDAKTAKALRGEPAAGAQAFKKGKGRSGSH